MEERIKESFNPVYNDAEQVKKCAEFWLGEEIVEAKVAIVIGHNGMNFVSSTDWRLTTARGTKRIWTFSVRPQYPNFLECVAGVSYSGEQGKFKVLPDEDEPRSAVVVMGNKRYDFAPGKALKIYVEPGNRFIATDCFVECHDNGMGPRVYYIIPQEETLYGKLDAQGKISQD